MSERASALGIIISIYPLFLMHKRFSSYPPFLLGQITTATEEKEGIYEP